MFLSSYQKSKWKSEKEIVLIMKIDLGTDIKPLLEKREFKKKKQNPQS